MTKNWKKNYSCKKKLTFFLSKTAIYLSLALHKVCPSYNTVKAVFPYSVLGTALSKNFSAKFYAYTNFST
jgi:hypothetical protein